MSQRTMTARQLRVMLIIAIVAVLLLMIGGFVYARSNLLSYATAVSRLNASAKAGDKNLTTLKNLDSRLQTEQETIAKSKNVVADPATYEDIVITDIAAIAKSSGVAITSFGFDATTTANSSQPAAAAPSAVPAALIAGITTKTVSVTVKSPLSYTSLLKFLEGIEVNDLQMQVTNVSITKEQGNNVTTQVFTIEVFVRS